MGGSVRCIRRTHGGTGRGDRVHIRQGGLTEPAQSRGLHHCTAVRGGLGHLRYQRLVLRGQLRGALVRPRSGAISPTGDDDVPCVDHGERVGRGLAALPVGLRRAYRGQKHPAQPPVRLDSTIGTRAHHGAACSRLHGQGPRAALSGLHHREGEPGGVGLRVIRHELRYGRRRPRRGRYQCRDAETRPRSEVGAVRAVGRGKSGRLHTEWDQREPRSVLPVHRQPRNSQFRRFPEQAEFRDRILRRHRWRVRARRRERVQGVPTVRTRPSDHTGDGKLQGEHAGCQRDLSVVRTTAPVAQSTTGDRRCRGCDLVRRRRGRVPLRPITQAAVGNPPLRWQLPGAREGETH